MENKKYFGSLDFVKFAAAFLVIAIHTSPLSSLHSGLDFVYTRILARLAVPFFLMASGYFVLPQYIFEHSKDYRALTRFLKKMLWLYVAAILLYLPVNVYADQLEGIGAGGFLRLLLFDGTFYHLWYLPASVIGILLLVILSKLFTFRVMVGIVALLYIIGLFGDSYYGFITDIPLLNNLYEGIFQISSYTRNGLFYAPAFLLLGCGIHQSKRQEYRTYLPFFLTSAIVMVGEGLLLKYGNFQRHDSMYITLPVCMYFLFQMTLSINASPSKQLRKISMWIYLIHPLVIILVRGVGKMLQLENLLTHNSLIHYIIVCMVSFAFSWSIHTFCIRILKKPFSTDRAWIELDKKNIEYNVTALQQLLPPDCQLMPAVKANAYGHGAVLISKELNCLGIHSFCVATVMEGVELRKNGVKGDILILGYTHPEQFFLLRRFQLIQTVVDYPYAEILSSYGKKLKVHLKIDTGMHRLGERADQLEEICKVFKLPNLVVNGAFTHLSADESRKEPEYSFTQAQAVLFYQVVNDLRKRGYSLKKIHLLASYGLINYPELAGDYARIGIALYGVLSNRSDLERCPVSLKPILSIKVRIALVKNIYAGETVGYGLQHAATENKRIAVLSIGYADGIPRALSNHKGKVLINEKEAPVIGNICMDQMIVDITEIPDVKSGDTAILIGKSGPLEISAYDLADSCDTITNEVLSRLGSRLSRILV